MANTNFVDYVKLFLASGDGGSGSTHLHREKVVAKGGPEGGAGGRGGHSILRGNPQKWTPSHLKYRKHIKAEAGESGGSAQCTGANGKDIYLDVPLGTVAKNAETGEVMFEITEPGGDPGSKAKLAVKANDMTIDAVGACVGLRGIRVQAVVTELQGEKIDIVPYSEDKAQYIVSALAPAEVTKVVLDEENGRIEVVVPKEQFSIAIGRRGQNVKLASQLLGCDIDVLTEEQEQERRANENKVRSQRFMEALDVDEMIAHLLIAEGFSTIDEVALVADRKSTRLNSS